MVCGESSKQIQHYIRLTELQPKLLDMVDNRRLNFTVAVDISYIDKESKADIRNPPSLLAHERSRFATCQWELLTPTDISIPLTHRLVLYALEAVGKGDAYSAFKIVILFLIVSIGYKDVQQSIFLAVLESLNILVMIAGNALEIVLKFTCDRLASNLLR